MTSFRVLHLSRFLVLSVELLLFYHKLYKMNQQDEAGKQPNQERIKELSEELAQDKRVRDQAEQIVREEDRNIERVKEEIEHLEHPVIELFVNGERKEWHKKNILYREVVALFYGEYEDVDTITYSVDYTHGPKGHEEGILNPGQTVPVINKMRFRVQKANRS